MRQEYFKEAVTKIGKDAVAELEALYDIYDERLYIWMATLWEPEIGGFYFSTSGKETDGFLPDIESTVQILRCLQTSGLTCGKPYEEAVPPFMRAKLVNFAKSLQDKNGYFYHPQWGKNIITPRRGRDLRWATDMLNHFGEKPYYPTPIERINDKKSDALPEWLQSLDAWKKYLDSFDMKTKSYWSSNMLSSQTFQIKAAGEEYVDYLFKWLAENQRSDNGLWEPQVNYASVNGLMKLSIMYCQLGAELPNAERAVLSAITAALSNEKIVFCCQFYNPLECMGNVLENMTKHGTAERAEQIRRIIIERAAELLSVTREKVLLCKRSDGSFSYNPEPRSRLSQKAPVSLGLEEGDVNGATICTNGIIKNVCKAFGIPKIPLYCKADSEIFFDMIENAVKPTKIYAKPDWFDDAINPEKLTENY
ncbi:MAG: hypothetical protein IJ488_01755 [Clostridia bacterium]|nr:hypothetical protein [Clostridia bacterium]